MADEFVNRDKIKVPDELYPLVGYVIVPKVVPAPMFDEYWREYQALQKELRSKKAPLKQWHNIFQIYNSRMKFVIDYHFAIANPTEDDKKREIEVEVPAQIEHPTDLPYPAIAAFVFHATQGVFMKTNFLPRSLRPSTTTTRETAEEE